MRKRCVDVNKAIMVIIALMVVTMVVGVNSGWGAEVNDNGKPHEVVVIGKLVRAAWSNMGTWFFVWDPDFELYDNSVVMEMGFTGPALEDLALKDKQRYLTDMFIALINDMYEEKVPLDRYIHDGNTLVFEYQNGVKLIWEYGDRKEPFKINE